MSIKKPRIRVNLARNVIEPILRPNSEITGLKLGKLIGSRDYGRVYSGTVLIDGVKKRVAIKEFHAEGIKKQLGVLSVLGKTNLEDLAEVYNKTIVDLRNAGVRLPVAKVILYNGKLYQISILFTTNGKSQFILHNESYSDEINIRLAKDYANMINAGYVPSSDVFENRKDMDVIALDLDLPVAYKLLEQRYGKEFFYGALKNAFNWIKYSKPKDDLFISEFLKHLKDPKVKRIIQELIPK